MQLVTAIDIRAGNALFSNRKGGIPNASILYEMQGQKRNEGCQSHYHEEWEASDSGCVSDVWDQDVQDRKGLSRPENRAKNRNKACWNVT